MNEYWVVANVNETDGLTVFRQTMCVNKPAHGDIISTDNGLRIILISNGMKHFDSIPDWLVEKIQEQRMAQRKAEVDALMNRRVVPSNTQYSRHEITNEEFSRYSGEAEAYHGLHW